MGSVTPASRRLVKIAVEMVIVAILATKLIAVKNENSEQLASLHEQTTLLFRSGLPFCR